VDPIDRLPIAASDDELEAAGIPVRRREVDADALWEFQARTGLSYTLALRYHIAGLELELCERDRVLDVGGGRGAFYAVWRSHVAAMFVCDLDAIDPRVAPSEARRGDVLEAELEHLDCNKAFVGHSIEHFVGSGDRELVRHLGGGLLAPSSVLIEPVFVGGQYLEVWNVPIPRRFDMRATAIHTRVSDFPGNPDRGMGFGRIYDPPALLARLLEPAGAAGFSPTLTTWTSGGRDLPNLERYAFRRRAVNAPYRSLLLSRD
jgi:hypothetical protein